MIETIFVLCCVLGVGIFFWDVKRKAMRHLSAVQNVKSKIATATKMTASFAAFSHGPKVTLLLASSGPYDLFLFHKIVDGTSVEQHQISLQKILAVQLIVDGITFKTTKTSQLPSINQRASDIARQEVESMSGDELQDIKRISLLLAHSTNGSPENLQISLYQAKKNDPSGLSTKVLLNALWWQQFLLAYIGKTPHIDTEPF